MKRLLGAFLVSLALCAPAQAEEPVLRVGIDAPYPPFAYTDPVSGKLAGFDYDMAVAMCEYMKRTCDIQVVPFDEIIPRIVEGKLDIGVAGMAKKPEREKLVLFSDKYFRSSSLFVEIPGTNTVSKAGLKGKRIGVQSGTTQEDYLKKEYTESTLVPMKSFEDIIKAVQQKEIDIAFIDGLPGYHFLKSEQGEGVDIAGDPVKLGSGSCAVLAKSLENERKAINKAIIEMRNDGEYNKINRKYFEFDVY